MGFKKFLKEKRGSKELVSFDQTARMQVAITNALRGNTPTDQDKVALRHISRLLDKARTVRFERLEDERKCFRHG